MEESSNSSFSFGVIPSIQSSNPERAQRIFAQTLGVGKQDLPALILSSNLCENYFVSEVLPRGRIVHRFGKILKNYAPELSKPEIDSCSGRIRLHFQNMAGMSP